MVWAMRDEDLCLNLIGHDYFPLRIGSFLSYVGVHWLKELLRAR